MADFTSMVVRRLRALFPCNKGQSLLDPRALEEGTGCTEPLADSKVADASFDGQRSLSKKTPLPDAPLISDASTDPTLEPGSDDDTECYNAAPSSTCQNHEYKDASTDTDELNFDIENPQLDDELDAPEEEEIEWTYEQLQETRETYYRTFYGEDETDYTRGPSRVVLTTDGIDDCTALLLTLPLSQALQKAIRMQRAYKKTKALAVKKTGALVNLEFALDVQIESHQSRLDSMEDGDDKREALEAELEIMQLMVEEYKMEQTAVENDLQLKGDSLRSVQAKANAILEDALVTARLLEPEEEESEAHFPAYDLKTEYKAFSQKLHDADEDPLVEEPPALDTSDDHMRIARTAEEKEKEQEAERLHQAVCDAGDRVEAAQADFDHRDQDRAVEEHARYAALQRGEQTEDDSSEAFDLRWHLHERALTRELIEAEEEYKSAQKAVTQLETLDRLKSEHDRLEADHDRRKVEIDRLKAEVDSISEMAEDESDSSEEESQDIIVPFAMPRVMRWLTDLPTGSVMLSPTLSRAEDTDTDEWKTAELDVGDSMSEILEREEHTLRNRHRAATDKWQSHQQELRDSFA